MKTLSQARVAGLTSRWLTNELNALARVGNWEGAIGVLQRIEPSNTVHENVFHYTTVISACSRAGKFREAFSVFDRMKAKRIRPNVFTYTVLIDACANAGQVDAAFRVYAEMKLKKEAPNVKTMTALVSACARVGRWEKAIRVLKEAEELSIAPNVFTYTAAMDGCRRASICKPAMALLECMQDPTNVRPNQVTYNTVLGACVAAKDNDAALRVYAKMVADGYRPIAYTRDLLIALFKGTYMEELVSELEIQSKPSKQETHITDSDSPAAMRTL